nr:MAG TPA: hypothetical protein [Caudoviricetes sp.]
MSSKIIGCFLFALNCIFMQIICRICKTKIQ